MLVSVFVWEVSVHPDWLSLDLEDNSVPGLTNGNERLSAEERANLAEIDSLPVLAQTINATPSPAPLTPPIIFNQNSKPSPRRNSQPALNTPNIFAPAPVPAPSPQNNPLSANPLVNVGLLSTIPDNSANVPSDTLNSFEGLLLAPSSSPSPMAPSHLQRAMAAAQESQSPPENSRISPENRATPAPTNPGLLPVPQPSGTSVLTNPLLITPTPMPTGTPESNPYQTQFNPYSLPSPNVNPGINHRGSPTVAPTQPPFTPNNLPTQNPALSTNNLESPSINPGGPLPLTSSQTSLNGNNSNNQQFQSIQPQILNFQVDHQIWVEPSPAVQPASPFSLERPVPGRYIGGGEINTFGNP
mgnify:CR=1 FL=1